MYVEPVSLGSGWSRYDGIGLATVCLEDRLDGLFGLPPKYTDWGSSPLKPVGEKAGVEGVAPNASA